MSKPCDCNAIRAEKIFYSSEDFFEFNKLLVESRLFESIPLGKLYCNVGFIEHHYKCKKCGTIWRLVEPDAPFPGIWEKVG